MNKFISFLRGINVSGQKKIKMEDLKKLYLSLGYSDVQTYIQSGNVVFTSGKEERILEKEISDKISQSFGFDVEITIKTKEYLEKILSINPYRKLNDFNTKIMYFTLLKDEPEQNAIDKLKSDKPVNDTFEVIGKEIYVYCPDGYGRTVYSNNYFENKLKIKATTRNWNTITKMIELAG